LNAQQFFSAAADAQMRGALHILNTEEFAIDDSGLREAAAGDLADVAGDRGQAGDALMRDCLWDDNCDV